MTCRRFQGASRTLFIKIVRSSMSRTRTRTRTTTLKWFPESLTGILDRDNNPGTYQESVLAYVHIKTDCGAAESLQSWSSHIFMTRTSHLRELIASKSSRVPVFVVQSLKIMASHGWMLHVSAGPLNIRIFSACVAKKPQRNPAPIAPWILTLTRSVSARVPR